MRAFLLSVVSGIATCLGGHGIAAFGQPLADGTDFNLAPGCSFHPIAEPPLVKWPVLVDWDSQGNLLVIESGGVAHPIIEHNKQSLHRLVRLFDDNHDGIMDRRELVADGLPFSEGVLCLGSRILVSAPPVIYELSDGDGDGYCERKLVWFDGQTITGCANDLHGPYLGRDGWVYWSKGAFAQQTHELLDGRSLSDKAAHIYRRRISGGAIEPVMSGGMDNPVGFAVLPNGERFFSSTFLVHPGDGLRDGVVHCIYGGVYGKDHSALEGVPRTGSLMPVMVHLGAAAPSGMICLPGSPQSGSSVATLVVALFNHRKVVALPLEADRSSYRTTPVDLVAGNRIDFHPTDVLADMDGSLIVVDTGGWYDLCCPSSKVDQELASGGIYRLTGGEFLRSREQPLPATRELAVGEEEVASSIHDPRPWVARSALLKVMASSDRYLDELKDQVLNPQNEIRSRRNALWALGSTGTPAALEFVCQLVSTPLAIEAASQPSPTLEREHELRMIACHLLSLHRYAPARQNLLKLIQESTRSKGELDKSGESRKAFLMQALVRAAVEALGRIGDSDSVTTLFAVYEHLQTDRVIDHSIRYAIFEIGEATQIAQFLESPSSKQRELALATLDLLGADSYLTANRLVDAATNADTGPTAVRLLLNRPELALEALSILGSRWSSEIQRGSPPELFLKLAKGWREDQAFQDWVHQVLGQAVTATQRTGQPINSFLWQWVECSVNAFAGQLLPEKWHPWISTLLQSEPERIAQAIASAKLDDSTQVPLVKTLMKIIPECNDDRVKQLLIACLPPRHLLDDPLLVSQRIEQLIDSGTSAAVDKSNRAVSWQMLKRLRIEKSNAGRLLDLLPHLTTAELLTAIEIIASVESPELDQRLMSQLKGNRSARGLPPTSLVNIYRHRDEPLRMLAQSTSDELTRSDPDVTKQIDSILRALPVGDPVRGLELFHSSKVNCGGCHQMGYLGGKIGPELSRIGASRTREALLEAVLYPNERIEQGFQATQYLTTDGRVINGIPAANSTGTTLEIRVSADRSESLRYDEIEEARTSDVSIMPGGMLELLSHQEMADLLSLLEAAK